MPRSRLMLLCLLALPLAMGLPTPAEPSSPHAGAEVRAIKALSEEEVASLLAGHGMGLAKAAELNHYPGPAHVLQLAAELGLTAEQRARTEALHAVMQAEAKRIGAEIVAKEAALEALFAEGRAAPDPLRALVAEIATLRGALRYRHLAAHLEMRRILTTDQVAQYDALRGYAGEDGGHGQHQHGMP